MSGESYNDNERPVIGSQPQDPHGRAALLLVESLLHGLIARAIVSVAEAAEIVDVAAEVNGALVTEPGGYDEVGVTPRSLLEALRASLNHDLPR